MKKLFLSCLALMTALAGTAEEWNLVTDVYELQEGDQIVLACTAKGKVASKTITGTTSKYLWAVDATFDGETLVEVPSSTAIFTLSINNSEWVLTSQEGKMLGATAAKKLVWDDGIRTWNITSDGISSTNSQYGKIQYNDQGSARFTVYTSTQTPIQIYRLGSSAPSVTITFDGFPYYRTSCALPTYKAGSTYTLPLATPEKDGQALKAWKYDGEEYAPGAEFLVPETDVLFVPVWDGEQAVVNTEARPAAKKTLRDGQLLIIRDGVEYNVLGVKVRGEK